MKAHTKKKIQSLLSIICRELRWICVGILIGIFYQSRSPLLITEDLLLSEEASAKHPISFIKGLKLFIDQEGWEKTCSYIMIWTIIWYLARLVFFGSAYGYLKNSLYGPFSRSEKSDDPEFETADKSKPVRLVVFRIRRRAKWATVGANASLVLIMISLMSGLLLFRSAETTASEGEARLRASAVKDELRYSETRLERLKQDLQYIESSISLARKQQQEASEKANIQEEDLTKDKMAIESDIKQIENRTNELMKMLRELSSPYQVPTAGYLWSILSTKIGSSLLILFLVQILISLYRYSTRLSAFYEARADGLQLAEEVDKLSLDSLIGLLSADRLDFGRNPKTPVQEIAEIVKEGLHKASEIGASSVRKQ